jgi:hypothetical protein
MITIASPHSANMIAGEKAGPKLLKSAPKTIFVFLLAKPVEPGLKFRNISAFAER